MKLFFSQLEAHLGKKLLALYVISGEDILLKQDALQMIRKAAKRHGFTERTRLVVETGFDWGQLTSTLYATSLLAEKRLIELDYRDLLPNKSAGEILQTYSEKPAKDTLFVINMGKLDDKTTKTAWYIGLEKNAVILPIWPIAGEQLPAWLSQRAASKYQLSLSKASCQVIADYVEGNLIAAAQALEKIYLLKAEQPLDEHLIKELLIDENRFTVFDFIDALISANPAKSLHILQHLKDEGIEPTLILWGITRELRLLAELIQQLKQGNSLDPLFKKHRVFARRQPLVRQCLSRLTAENCRQYISAAADLDQVIKGARQGDIWDALALFCLRFGV